MAKRRGVPRGATVLAGGLVGAVLGSGHATAQPISGVYIGAGVGYALLQDQKPSVDTVVQYAATRSVTTAASYDGGVGLVGSVGYGLGNGVRLEVEGNYRSNTETRATSPGTAIGSESKYGAMANIVYDAYVGLNWIYPYFGAGVGYQLAQWDRMSVQAGGLNFQTTPAPVNVNQALGKFAYQAIAGVGFPVEYIPGLALTVEYRYLGLAGTRDYNATATFQYASPAKTRVHVSDDSNHTFMVGLRYAFNTEPATPAPLAAVAPSPAPYYAPAPATTRTFIVFFDWDRSDLTPRARDVVAEAVRASASTPHTRIEVTGNADTSGSAEYNARSSQARAETVANEMMRWGVPRSVIDIRAYGDTRPLVPTGPGVREAQNRRVEIVYR
jgi:outer membrane protein OmpA-like peptidoglycan-associated protein